MSETATTTLRILIADDYPDAAESLRVLLQLWGHEVCVVTDGVAALGTAFQFRPQVVFLDIQMPGLHGAEVARRLRATPTLASALLVATTATEENDARLADYHGVFDTYMIKPYNLDRLERLLEDRAALVGHVGGPDFGQGYSYGDSGPDT